MCAYDSAPAYFLQKAALLILQCVGRGVWRIMSLGFSCSDEMFQLCGVAAMPLAWSKHWEPISVCPKKCRLGADKSAINQWACIVLTARTSWDTLGAFLG